MKNAYYRSIPVYFNPDTDDIKGRNKIYDIMLDIAIWFDIDVLGLDYFPIHVIIDED